MEESIIEDIREHCTLLGTTKSNKSIAIEGQAVFPVTCCVFRGHFPSHPILPAIVQLGVVRALAEKALATQLVPLSMEKIKFKEVITPEELFLISMEMKNTEQQWEVHFQLHKEKQGSIASGKVKYKVQS